MRDAASRRCRSPRKRPAWTSPSMPGAPFPLAGCRARHPADVGRHRLAVDTHFAVARHARDARLQGRGQIRDVFQKQRAAARGCDPAVARRPLEIGRDHGGRRAEQQPLEPGRDRRPRSPRARKRRMAALACSCSPRATDSTSAPRGASSRTPPSARAARRTRSCVRATAADRPTSSRARRGRPRRAAEIRSTRVIVSGMAGLNEGNTAPPRHSQAERRRGVGAQDAHNTT